MSSEKPYVPFYKPYGMSDEEYSHEVKQAEQRLAEWEAAQPPPPSGKESVEGLSFGDLKWEIGKIFHNKISIDENGNIEGNPMIHAITEFVYKLLAAKAATPDSREEGKGENFLKVLQNNWQAQIAGYYNVDKTDAERVIRQAVIDEYKDLIAIYKELSPAPVTDKGVDVKFYLRKNDPVSDAVDDKFEFFKWIDEEEIPRENGKWVKYFNGKDNYLTTSELYYTIFLTQKQKV